MKKSIVITSLFLILTAVSCGSNNYGGMRRNAIKAESEETYTYYFVNTKDWTNPYLYGWNEADQSIKLEDAAWPGVDMSKWAYGRNEWNHQVYKIETPKIIDRIIFVGYEGSYQKQSSDVQVANEIDLWGGHNQFGIGDWSHDSTFYYYVDSSSFEESKAVNYRVDINKWKYGDERYALYTYGDQGDKWEDLTVSGRYINFEMSAEKNANSRTAILCRMNGSSTDNNWDNRWNQEDLPRFASGSHALRIENFDADLYEIDDTQQLRLVMKDYAGDDYRYTKETKVHTTVSTFAEHLHCNATPFRVTEYNGAYLYMSDIVDDKIQPSGINSGYMDYEGDMWHFYKNEEEIVRDWKVSETSVFTYYYSLYNFVNEEDALDLAKWKYNDGAFEYAVTDLSVDENNKYNDKVLQAFQYFALPMVKDTAGENLGITKLVISELLIGSSNTLQFSIYQGASPISTAAVVR